MPNTGYLRNVYTDENQFSPTYGSTYSERNGWMNIEDCIVYDPYGDTNKRLAFKCRIVPTSSSDLRIYFRTYDSLSSVYVYVNGVRNGSYSYADLTLNEENVIEVFTDSGWINRYFGLYNSEQGSYILYMPCEYLIVDCLNLDSNSSKILDYISTNGDYPLTFNNIRFNGDCDYAFYSSSEWYTNNVSINGLWGTSNATTFYSMFYNCSGLTSLDVSGFDTSNATTFYRMFESCSGLTSLDVSNFNTSNVTTFQWMFNNCSSLTSLDVSNFDTSKSTTFYGMFDSCSSLTSLDVSGFDTSNATTFYNMFYNCRGLTSLDVSNFDTSKSTTFQWMFYNCSSLTSLDVSEKFVISGTVTNMFYNCSKLEHINGQFGSISVSVSFGYLPLDYESAVMIINALAETTSTKTLTLSSSTYSLLSDADIAVATNKGWTVASA